MDRSLMGVRFLVVWMAVGLGLSLGGCGGTSKKPNAEPVCPGDGCPDQPQAGAGTGGEGPCRGDECQPVTCMPEQRECQAGDVYECNADGDGFALYDDCEEGVEACDPASLLCVLRCELDGNCPEPVCKVGDRLCIGNDVHVCNPEGNELVFSEACGVGVAHCVDDAPGKGFAYCTQNECVAGLKVCGNDNTVRVCTAEGTLPAEGEDCGDDVCINGACEPKLCEPDVAICVDGDVHKCETLGTGSYATKTCPDTAPCEELAPGVLDCSPLFCTPNATGCVGNAVGTCAADGRSLSAVTSNCSSSNQVCNATPICIDSAIDVPGVAEQVEYVGADAVLGNIIDVHSARRLTKLEAHLMLAEPRDLRWLVYQQTGAQFEQICSEITTNHQGSAYFQSDQLSCLLEAGKRYVLGVAIVVGEGYHYYDTPPNTASVSFGSIAGRTINGYATPMFFDVSSGVFRQRITTELP